MTRHGKARPTESVWPVLLGSLVGMVVGVVAFAILWEAIR